MRLATELMACSTAFPDEVAVSIRLSRDVLDHYKAKGPNWQTRIAEALRKAIAG